MQARFKLVALLFVAMVMVTATAWAQAGEPVTGDQGLNLITLEIVAIVSTLLIQLLKAISATVAKLGDTAKAIIFFGINVAIAPVLTKVAAFAGLPAPADLFSIDTGFVVGILNGLLAMGNHAGAKALAGVRQKVSGPAPVT